MTHDDELCDRTYPVHEFMHVQQRHWRLERIGWMVFLMTVLLGALGVFSQGVLSRTTGQSADGVDFQRFERTSAVSEMTVRLRGEPAQVLRLEITGDLMDKFAVQGIQPAPLSSESFEGGLGLTFRTDQAGEAAVYLALRAAGAGSSRSQFAMTGSSPVAVDQFIYP